jgi:uncharacterized SAM-binding protein YcdF (DUF218 family)
MSLSALPRYPLARPSATREDASEFAMRADRIRRGRILRAIAALLVVAFSAASFVWLGMGAAEFQAQIREQPDFVALTEPADGVVALTGGPDRITVAAGLLASGQAKRMLISGVNQLTTRSQLSRETPRYRELIDCCVDIGYLAENTFGNAVETARWAKRNGVLRLVVVTSDYHMPRALDELRAALPEATLIAYPVRSPRLQPSGWWRDAEALRLVVFEYVKYLRTQWRAQFDPHRAQTILHGVSRA